MNLFCTVCTKAIPADRMIRGCNECSTACRTARRNIYRKLRNSRVCKYCGRKKQAA